MPRHGNVVSSHVLVISEQPGMRARSGREQGTAQMKHVSVFNVLRAAVATGALVGALATPAIAAAGNTDSDHDGLTNRFERNWSHTNPFRADSDRDGIKDAQENPDHDGLTNKQEQKLHDDP